MARKQTADQLTENACSLIEQIQDAAATEVRKDFANCLRELARGTDERLMGHMEKDKRPVSDDLRAGLALAAELLADMGFGA